MKKLLLQSIVGLMLFSFSVTFARAEESMVPEKTGADSAVSEASPEAKNKIAELQKLKKEDPEKFKKIVSERKRKLRKKMKELKEKDPEKYEEVKKNMAARRRQKLQRMRKEDPEKFRQAMKEKEEKLEEMKEKNPERYKKFMKSHPRIAERMEKHEKEDHDADDKPT